MSKNFNSIRNELSNFFSYADFDEKLSIYNEWRDSCCDEEYIIHDTDDEFDDMLSSCSPSEIYEMGHDGTCMDDYFQYDNLDGVTFYDRTETLEMISECISDIIDYIIKNEDGLGNETIMELLDDDEVDEADEQTQEVNELIAEQTAEVDKLESEAENDDPLANVDFENIPELMELKSVSSAMYTKACEFLAMCYRDTYGYAEYPERMSSFVSSHPTIFRMSVKLAKLEAILLE